MIFIVISAAWKIIRHLPAPLKGGGNSPPLLGSDRRQMGQGGCANTRHRRGDFGEHLGDI